MTLRCSSCSAPALYRIVRTDGLDFEPVIYACEVGARSVPSNLRRRLSASFVAPAIGIPVSESEATKAPRQRPFREAASGVPVQPAGVIEAAPAGSVR